MPSERAVVLLSSPSLPSSLATPNLGAQASGRRGEGEVGRFALPGFKSSLLGLFIGCIKLHGMTALGTSLEGGCEV